MTNPFKKLHGEFYLFTQRVSKVETEQVGGSSYRLGKKTIPLGISPVGIWAFSTPSLV